MGKATRWLRALLGMKREKNADQTSCLLAGGERKEKNRWSFSKSGKELPGKVQKLPEPPPRTAVADVDWQKSYPAEGERNEHAIAVAAASAAAADAAVAAAQAAVAVVRLTSQTRGALFNEGVEILAAVRIQKIFRGFLARKALRALRGIVKLQALVRGYLVRKRAAATLHSMQALIRAQTTIRTQRARRSNNKENKYQSEKLPAGDGDVNDLRSLFSDKIVEIDSPFQNPKSKSRRFTTHFTADDRPSPYFWTMASPARFSSGDFCFPGAGEEYCGRLSTANSTPRMENAGWATPARSVYGGEGYFGNYPNYMANTKSFKAKLRSRSAPKQRPEVWTRKRTALNEIIGARNSISAITMQKCCNRIEEDDGFDEH